MKLNSSKGLQVLLRLDLPDYDRILREHHVRLYARRKEFLQAQSVR